MDNEYILSIDIGGTSIKIGVVCKENVIESTSVRNVYKGKPDLLVLGIKSICDNFINKYNITKIGIGCPGDILKGVVIFASNLGWKDFNILKAFNDVYPEMIINVDNDGNAACQAEIKFGKLKNVENGLFVTIGKGVGGAIIVDNKIVHGSHNKGGRFGHILTNSNGRKCNCGRRGCFETYASVSGLIQTVKETNEKLKDKYEPISEEKLSGYTIVKLYKEFNPIINEAIQKWNKDVAEGLLDLCHVFDPSIIVIAGGITESGLLNLNFIKSFLEKHYYDDCKIVLSKYKGKTGLVGAAALLDEYN